MYKNDLEAFNRKAAEWTQNYAREITMDDKVQHLMEMGFEAAQCREALERANGDQTVALNYLLQWDWQYLRAYGVGERQGDS